MVYQVINQSLLKDLYTDKKLSMMQISAQLGCSHHKVAYWMSAYKIPRRSRSESVYLRHNPSGDPFKLKTPSSPEEYFLYGLGLGLYWGEGTKANKNAVRLGNSDPRIIKMFMKFLVELYGVDQDSLRFGLQVFSDVSAGDALQYWRKQLQVPDSQFYKPLITRSGRIGSYRVKNKYGVVTIYFGNTKLRNILVRQIADVA